jgi:hypothetical protein
VITQENRTLNQWMEYIPLATISSSYTNASTLRIIIKTLAMELRATPD